MSLHDIDKTNSNRITPILNSADDVSQRMAQGTNSIQNSNDPDETDGLQFKERQVLAVQDGYNKAIMGFYGDANKFGLKVAEDGVDVLTASDDQLIFNSEQNVFKIISSGTIKVTAPAVSHSTVGPYIETGTTVVNHEVGHTPAILAFVELGGNYVSIPYLADVQTATNFSVRDNISVLSTSTTIQAEADRLTDIYVAGAMSRVAREYTIRYYLLQETAS